MLGTTLIQVNSVNGISITKIELFDTAGDKKHFRNSVCMQVNDTLLYVDAKTDEYDVAVLITPKEIGKAQNIIDEVKRNARTDVINVNIARLSLMELEIGYYFAVKCMSATAISAMGKFTFETVTETKKILYTKCDVHKIGFFIGYFNKHYPSYLPPVLAVVFKKVAVIKKKPLNP
jgi:hypothetical protein